MTTNQPHVDLHGLWAFRVGGFVPHAATQRLHSARSAAETPSAETRRDETPHLQHEGVAVFVGLFARHFESRGRVVVLVPLRVERALPRLGLVEGLVWLDLRSCGRSPAATTRTVRWRRDASEPSGVFTTPEPETLYDTMSSMSPRPLSDSPTNTYELK
jgi:hypothetical protein